MSKSSDSVFDKPLKMKHHEPAPPTDWEAFMTIVRSRRSVRVYDGTPIPEETMRKCLGAALLAPNSSNLQPWEFYWVRSPDKKQTIVKACLSQPAAKTAAELVVCVARTNTWKRNSSLMLRKFEEQPNVPAAARAYYEKIVPFAYGLGPLGVAGIFKSLLMSAIGLFRPIPREPTTRAELKTWAVKSTALACENLMLAFRAAGFDSCPMEGLDSRRIRKLLDLPSDAVVVMVISAGKRAADGVYGPQIRFDESLFIREV
jgi:nitroreductase